MGCCSSTERSPRPGPSQQPETITSPSGVAPLTSGAGFTHNAQSSNIYSPASSRAPLTGVEPSSAVSSPRQSNTHRRRSTATQQSNADGALSSHYNVPLVVPRTWKSSSKIWTPSQVAKERQDFFDTRVTGRREIWEALRQVAECIRDNDLNTAQGILDAAGITLPTGRLEDGCYDERGELYKVSHVVLKDPDNIQSDTEVDDATVIGEGLDAKAIDIDNKKFELPSTTITQEEAVATTKGKDVLDPDVVKVKCRLSHTGTDTYVSLGKTQMASVLFTRLHEEVDKPKSTRLRIFYLGKELKEKEKNSLEDFGWSEGHVLNIYVIIAPP